MENIQIIEFNPFKASDEELFVFADFINDTFREIEKDDPIPSREERVKNLKYKEPNLDEYLWLIWDSDKLIGFSEIGIKTKIAPNYEENKYIANYYIKLVKEYRRKGIGTECLKKIITKAKENGITVLQTHSLLNSGNEFCQKLNGILAIESMENRCLMSDVNWELMEEWRKQGRERGEKEGRYLQWFEKCPEDIIEDYCNMYTETMNQQPLGEIEGRAKITPESRRITEQRFEKLGYIWHAVITREKDGKISGVTDVTFIPDRPYKIYQELTGVLMDYRGKGLGKWLKSEMLFFLRKKYPDVKYISTGNANSNAPMLAINIKMGFKPHLPIRNYKFYINDLENRIKEIENQN
ncbi:MAG: GNAT family N-acetyltransferase [Candidatus Thorarchaeota archaeon]